MAVPNEKRGCSCNGIRCGGMGCIHGTLTGAQPAPAAPQQGYVLNTACVRALADAARKYGQDRVTFGVMEPGAGPLGLPAYVGVVSESVENLLAAAPAAQPADSALDSERLEWLEQQGDGGVHVDRFTPDGKTTYILRDGAWGKSLGYGPTLREAIDRARTLSAASNKERQHG